jgi:DNA-binding transcriptional MerR regulator
MTQEHRRADRVMTGAGQQMRIAELSRRSGAPVATIKYYLRERLLAAGVPTARNQATYGTEHVARLRLIGILTGMGQLSLAATGEVLAALDAGLPLPDVVALLHPARGTTQRSAHSSPSRLAAADARVDALIARCGWHVRPDGPDRAALVLVLAALDGCEPSGGTDPIGPYADAAEQVTRLQLDLVDRGTAGPAARVTRLVALETAFDVLRRLAREHHQPHG